MATITIDYCSASFAGQSALAFQDLAGIGPQVEDRGGRLGYTSSKKGTRGFVAWGGENGNSHIQIQGGHHKEAEALLQVADRVTRLDIALDIRCPKFISELKHHIRTRSYRGASRNVKEILVNGSLETMYIGSRTSEKYIRVYDKAKEQKMGPMVNWWRFEVELKGDFANAVATIIRAGGKLEDVLRGIIEFTETPKRRSKIASFWLRLSSNKVRAVVQRNQRGTLAERVKWLKRQYGNTINELRAQMGAARLVKEIYENAIQTQSESLVQRANVIRERQKRNREHGQIVVPARAGKQIRYRSLQGQLIPS